MKNLKTITTIIGFPLLLFSCGNSANTEQIKIGAQTWTAKNPDVTIFRNGPASHRI